MIVDTGALDAQRPIVDCHHHLWHPHDKRYYADAFQADIVASGHNVVASVYVEGSAMYRATGPEAFRTVGEAEFVAGMAAMSESGILGPARICEGYVGAADLTLGDAVDDVLDALSAASGDRLRGIRGSTIWDADPIVNTGTRPMALPGLMASAAFRAGVKRLARRELVYDSWQYFPQLPEVCKLAQAVPDAALVINHCGGLLGIGPYAGPGTFEHWRRCILEASREPNLFMKLGGLAGARTGFGYEKRQARATAIELVRDWQPYIETCIEHFGPDRCMFESNFPVDRTAGDYRTIWNAFKTITASFSDSEKDSLFSGTASRLYKIGNATCPTPRPASTRSDQWSPSFTN